MSNITFVIPGERAELLSGVTMNYVVKNVIIPAEIAGKLEEAQMGLREEGAAFIIDNFDTYYSVLHHSDTLPTNLVFKAYNDLVKAVVKLDEAVQFLLDDKDSLDDETKAKMVTILKMLLYIFIQFVVHLEEKKRKNSEDLGGKAKNKKRKEEKFAVDKSNAVNLVSNIAQREINLFWDPPVVEHDFVNLLAELCYALLKNPTIKHEKELRMDMFGLFGNLIKSHDYGKTFVTHLIRSIRTYEHVASCVPEGIKTVVEQFNCRGLVHNFVKETTEWEVDETFGDAQGTKCSSMFLTELAVLMPVLMIPEVMYLNQYLAYESPPLRVSILNVITEVILNVLTKHDLSEDEKESRDDFLDILIEHVRDFAAAVRVKVIQNLARLQKKNAIPLNYQNEVLEKVIQHFYDKGANVRKAAINCVTTFLQHNPFGANLQLRKTEEELSRKIELLNRMEATYKETKLRKMEELDAEWSKIENDVKTTIEQQVNEDDDDDDDVDDDSPQPQLDKDELVDKIRIHLYDKKYIEAFKLCRLLKDSIAEWKNMRKLSEKDETVLYLKILQSFFVNAAKLTDELRTGAGMTAEDVQKIETLENIIKYLENTTSFLKVLDAAMKPMKELLFTQTVSDMHEAINFFVTAYQFKIDNASEGVLEMLKLMQYNEPERKEAVVSAFKTIYLTTDTNNMTDHTVTIVNRLIGLLKEIDDDRFDDFQNIISEWTAKGVIDNSVIDKCWQYYTQRTSTSTAPDDARAAADLLRMAAIGRRTIITKNLNVVTTMAFSDRFKDDMLFLASSCRLLAVAGIDKIDIQSKDPPFKIKHVDSMFQNLADILVENFTKTLPYYSDAMQAALDFVFRVCSRPTEICEKILQRIREKMDETKKNLLLVIRFCEFLGCLAMNILGFLDNTVYRELKRRNYLREARKENKKNKNKNRKSKTKNNKSLLLNESILNDSGLMGAEAEDTDAEFILNVLENYIVSNCGVIGQHYSFLANICQRPDLYGNDMLQYAAVTTLMRYMLVSSKFCRDNIRLLFTIFEKTTYSAIKCTILMHCSDLLTRFPNIVEPWSPRIYGGLKDDLVEVRKTAFFALSNLILRDMIRAHSHISEMAACLIDKSQEMADMCKTFFGRLAQKENNLANVIPDIFSHLVKTDDVSEENLRYIMKFLFDLVDNSKRTENLVDRFCCKYTPSEDLKLNRNITYCLSLINYNEKALRKLHEKFSQYKHHLHDAEVYSTFQQILTECSKPKVGKTDMKPIVADIESCIASVFEVTKDGQPSKLPPQVKTAKKTSKSRSTKKKTQKQKSSSESDSEDDRRSKNKKMKKNRANKK